MTTIKTTGRLAYQMARAQGAEVEEAREAALKTIAHNHQLSPMEAVDEWLIGGLYQLENK